LINVAIVADIAGFTAWSSIRDPHQVFTLLESIFQTFDAAAKKFGVFKVETIGDCYVGTFPSVPIDTKSEESRLNLELSMNQRSVACPKLMSCTPL
jgi:class 3 adenylate cyclase